MNDSKGIAGLLGHQLTLEERIEAHLMRAPADAELIDDYVDPIDRQRVRHRALISALLDAYFEHGFRDVGEGDLDIEMWREPSGSSELADARRDFAHDVEFLNAGRSAQTILSPTKTDTALTEKPISAKIKRLILWLAVIHLHQEGLDEAFPTQQTVIAEAAKSTGLRESSFLSELSRYKTQKGPKPGYISHFWGLVAMAQELARAAGNEKDAFSLLLPAARGISAALPQNGR
jgi:hypothetical protein